MTKRTQKCLDFNWVPRFLNVVSAELLVAVHCSDYLAIATPQCSSPSAGVIASTANTGLDGLVHRLVTSAYTVTKSTWPISAKTRPLESHAMKISVPYQSNVGRQPVPAGRSLLAI
jgi:hypothetical protein